jgi:hypothetical protein
MLSRNRPYEPIDSGFAIGGTVRSARAYKIFTERSAF